MSEQKTGQGSISRKARTVALDSELSSSPTRCGRSPREGITCRVLPIRPYGKTDLGFVSSRITLDLLTAQSRAAYKGGRSPWSLLLSIAFDQHAATTVAAVLIAGPSAPPALHTLTSDSPTILRFVDRLRGARAGAMLLRGRAVWLRIAAVPDAAGHRLRGDRPGADSPASRATASRRIGGMPASWPCSIGPARSRPSTFRPSRKKRRAISSAVAKTSAPICCVPNIGSRSFCCATAVGSRARRRRGRSASRRLAARPALVAARPRADPPRVSPRRRRSGGSVAGRRCELRDLLDARALAGPRRASALFPRYRRSHRADDRRGTGRRAPLSDGPEPHGLHRAGPLGTLERHKAEARGAITKTGNAHLRRVLVEAAWQYRHHPFVGPRCGATARRARRRHSHRVAGPARLHRRYRRLAARGKPKQLIVTAVARELTGFLWAALTQ